MPSLEGLKAQFKRLDALTSKLNFRSEPKEEVTEASVREEGLRRLAAYPECDDALVTLLEERISDLQKEIPDHLESHAKLCELEGKKYEAQLYLTMFKQFIQGE